MKTVMKTRARRVTLREARQAATEGYQPPKGRRVPREEYLDYIRSAAWMAKRVWWARETRADRCEGCEAPWSVQGGHLHHRTYKRLGHEELGDLAAVCADCHDRIHATLGSWRYLEKHTYRVLAQIRSECSKNKT